jgi:TM2 domain-containing membrane protein YozV
MSNECGSRGGTGGMLWLLGLIGAAIYFIGNSEGFWPTVLAFLKALVWPVFLVWKLLEFLKV